MFKSRTLKLLKGLGNNSLDVTKDEKSVAIDNTQPNHVEKVMRWLESEFSDLPDDNENVQQNNYCTFVDGSTTIGIIDETLKCVPVNTIVNNEADYKIDENIAENIDYYDLQNVCEETTSVKDIGHYDINETMVQSQDDNIIIELNDWNKIFDCVDESTNPPENDEVTTSNVSNVDNIHNLESLTSKRSRWSQSQPNLWKKNINKKMRSSCQEYTSRIKKVDKKMNAKIPKVVDCSKCKFKCQEYFTEKEREMLCKEYWNLNDFNRQKDFILSCLEIKEATQRLNRVPKTQRPRSLCNFYYFSLNMKKIRVCQKFFSATLCISNGPINTAVQGRSENKVFIEGDKRGKHCPSNKTSTEDVNEIKSHINSFPVVESHYTRKSTKRLYLDEKLSISKMYELFKDKYKIDHPHISTKIPQISVYRKIFCTNFNYSFFKPKKDQCAACDRYKTASIEDKIELEQSNNEHLDRMHQSFIAKDIDNTLTKITSNYVVASFDLQSTLQIPCSDVSLMYYSRKLNMFNLTVYEVAPPQNAHCFTWTEINGKRGSSEIGSCLLKWIQTLPTEVTNITLYSDSCGGQNRNHNIMALMIYIIQTTNINQIEHKFMESGHSMMEVDSMHSAIENAKRNVPVYAVQDWLTIFQVARSTRNRNKSKPPYEVKEMKYKDFINLQQLSSSLIKNKKVDTEGNIMNWLKVKCFKYKKNNPYIVGYKYDYFNEYQYINVGKKNVRSKIATTNINNLELKCLYSKPLPISHEKKKDLLKLCEKNVIPDMYHTFYKSLPSIPLKKDKAPEPGESDSELDED